MKHKLLNELKENTYGSDGKFNSNKTLKYLKTHKDKFIEKTKELFPWIKIPSDEKELSKTVREVLYCLENNVELQPKCDECNEPFPFSYTTFRYFKVCQKCGRKSRKLSLTAQLNKLDFDIKSKDDLLIFLEKYSLKQNGTVCAKSVEHILKSKFGKTINNFVSENFSWIGEVSSGKKITEILYCLRNNITKQPKCVICKRPVTFYSTTGYKTRCYKCTLLK